MTAMPVAEPMTAEEYLALPEQTVLDRARRR